MITPNVMNIFIVRSAILLVFCYLMQQKRMASHWHRVSIFLIPLALNVIFNFIVLSNSALTKDIFPLVLGSIALLVIFSLPLTISTAVIFLIPVQPYDKLWKGILIAIFAFFIGSIASVLVMQFLPLISGYIEESIAAVLVLLIPFLFSIIFFLLVSMQRLQFLRTPMVTTLLAFFVGIFFFIPIFEGATIVDMGLLLWVCGATGDCV